MQQTHLSNQPRAADQEGLPLFRLFNSDKQQQSLKPEKYSTYFATSPSTLIAAKGFKEGTRLNLVLEKIDIPVSWKVIFGDYLSRKHERKMP